MIRLMFEMYIAQHVLKNFRIYEFNEINLTDCTVQSQKLLASTSTKKPKNESLPATILAEY